MSMSAQFFQRKGIKDGDPMSVAVGFLLLLVMYKWLTTAAVTPLSVLPGNAPLVSMTNAFLPLGILVVPIMLLMYFAAFLDEPGGAGGAARRVYMYANYTGSAERAAVRRLGGFVEKTEARRAAKKKHTTKSGVIAQ